MKIVYVVLALLAVGFLAGSFYISYDVLSQGSTDLYPTWKAAQLFWKENVNPYDERIGQESQDTIYGRPAKEDEDEFQFVYPFYSIFHIGPLALLEFQWAAAIYIEVLLIGLLAAMAMSLNMIHWLPSPLVLAVLLLFTLLGYFTVRGLLLAQPGFLVYIFHLMVLWAIAKNRDTLAGVMLAFSTLKPQNSFLVVPLVLLWALVIHRRRILTAFAGVFASLLVVSFILEPDWFDSWLDRVTGYAGYAATYPTTYILADIFPEPLDAVLYGVFSGLLVLFMLNFWKALLWDGDTNNLWWVFFLTATVTLMISPRTATTSYVEMYPVLYITAMLMSHKKQTWIVVVGVLVLLFGYWVLHIATVPPKSEGGAGREARIVYVVFPVLILALLWGYRHSWPQLDSTTPAG